MKVDVGTDCGEKINDSGRLRMYLDVEISKFVQIIDLAFIRSKIFGTLCIRIWSAYED